MEADILIRLENTNQTKPIKDKRVPMVNCKHEQAVKLYRKSRLAKSHEHLSWHSVEKRRKENSLHKSVVLLQAVIRGGLGKVLDHTVLTK